VEVSLSPYDGNLDVTPQSTGADGTVTFTNLPSQIYFVDIEQAGYFETQTVGIAPDEEETTSFTVTPTATLSGEVLTDSGDPVSGVSVRLVGDGSSGTVETGENGEFSFDNHISESDYRVALEPESGAVIYRDVSVIQGDNSRTFIISNEYAESVNIADSESMTESASRILDVAVATTENNLYGSYNDEDPPGSISSMNDFFFVDDSGAYYTTGPCAWHSTQETCELFRPDYSDVDQAQSQGMAGGFVTGMEETADGAVETLHALANPVQTIAAILEMGARILSDLGLIEDIIRQIPEEIQQMQEENNPYSQSNPELYDAYERGWYAGYAAYRISSSLAGVGAANYISNGQRLSDVASTVRDASTSRLRDNFETSRDLQDDVGEEATDLGHLSATQSERVTDLSDSGVLSDDATRHLGSLTAEDPEFAENWLEMLQNYNTDLTPNTDLESSELQAHADEVTAAAGNSDISGVRSAFNRNNGELSLNYDADDYNPDEAVRPPDESWDINRLRTMTAEMREANIQADRDDVTSVTMEPDVGPDSATDVDLELETADGTEYVETKRTSTASEATFSNRLSDINEPYIDTDNNIDCDSSVCTGSLRYHNDERSLPWIGTQISDTFAEMDPTDVAVDRIRIYIGDSTSPYTVEINDDGTVDLPEELQGETIESISMSPSSNIAQSHQPIATP
jgi:hypothetical protein